MPDGHARRPSIFQLGTVLDTGTHLIVKGWGLGLCEPHCGCHRHPDGGYLVIVEDVGAGTVGLKSFAEGCGCCEPWHAEELQGFVRDFAEVAWLEVQPG